MELCSCFQRFEQKYLLDTDTYQKLRLELTPYMVCLAPRTQFTWK